MTERDEANRTAADEEPANGQASAKRVDASGGKQREETKEERQKQSREADSRQSERRNEPERNGPEKARPNADARSEGARPAHPNTSESDEPSEPTETGELKKDQATPVVSIEGKKIDDLIDRVSKTEEKIEKLLAVNREMSLFFAEQMETIEALRNSTNSIAEFLQSDATLKKKLDKFVQNATTQDADPAQVQKAVRMRGTLSRLERWGTL